MQLLILGGNHEKTIVHRDESRIAIKSPWFGIGKASDADLIHEPLHWMFMCDACIKAPVRITDTNDV
jgi:hypothetical protein